MYRMVLIREPSVEEELESLVALHAKCSEAPGDHVSASTTMLMAPLLSPEALHRFEVGRGAEVREGVRILSPVELAYAVEPCLFRDVANKDSSRRRSNGADRLKTNRRCRKACPTHIG